jgi:hypothetical protein
MQFFYTGSSTFQGQQNDPNLSLGGFISSTVVSNNSLNNIFSDLSYQTVQQKRQEVRGLILKNTLGTDATTISFGYQYPDVPTFKLEVAFVAINLSTPQVIEKIANGQANPYFATFVEANMDLAHGIDNSVDIGNLLNGTSVAIWFRRTVISSLTPPVFPDLQTEMAWWENITNPNADSSQLIKIIINYNTNQ